MVYRQILIILGLYYGGVCLAPPVVRPCHENERAALYAPPGAIVGPIVRGLSLWPQTAFGPTAFASLTLLSHPTVVSASAFAQSELSDFQIVGMGTAMSRSHARFMIGMSDERNREPGDIVVEDAQIREFWNSRIRDVILARLGNLMDVLERGSSERGIDALIVDKKFEATRESLRRFLAVICKTAESNAGKEISGRYRAAFRRSTPDPEGFLKELKALAREEFVNAYPDESKTTFDALWEILAKPIL